MNDLPASNPAVWSSFDRTQLPRPLDFNQSEFNWYIVQGQGRGTRTRNIALMFTVHCTGSRLESLKPGPSLLRRDQLPATWTHFLPSWLPIVSPIELGLDDSPLFNAVVYDLDCPERALLHYAGSVEERFFDPDTFSLFSGDGSFRLEQLDPAITPSSLPDMARDFFWGARFGTVIAVNARDFELELFLRPLKPPVTFGDDGTPAIRHGSVKTHYVQRPRFEVFGQIKLKRDGTCEVISDFRGEASQDRQWLSVGHSQLKWIWPHLRLADGRELMGYVIRDSGDGRWASANDGQEVGRAGWLIDVDGRVRKLAKFNVRSLDEGSKRTERGLVPTRFSVVAPELELRIELEHIVAAPFVRMKAFGGILDAGAWEGPARIVRSNQPISGHCWVEVVNAATARIGSPARLRP